MSKKLTNRLSFVMIAILVVFAFGLVMMATPAVQSADAEINLYASKSTGGGLYFTYLDDGQSQDPDYWLPRSDVNIKITDIDSGDNYDFNAAASAIATANPSFRYPIGVEAADFINILWQIEVYERDKSTIDPVAFNAYWASVNEDGSLGDYLDAAPDKIGTYYVVLCIRAADDDVSKEYPRAYAAVGIYETHGPFTVYNTVSSYGLTPQEIVYFSDEGTVGLDRGYVGGADFEIKVYTKGDEDDCWSWNKSSHIQEISAHDVDAPLPAGEYEILLRWSEATTYYGNYTDGEATIPFYVLPRVIDRNYSADDFSKTWGSADIPQPASLADIHDVTLRWMYYDAELGDAVELPSGLDIVPGTYYVWPKLVGDPADAGSVVLGSISAEGIEIDEYSSQRADDRFDRSRLRYRGRRFQRDLRRRVQLCIYERSRVGA